MVGLRSNLFCIHYSMYYVYILRSTKFPKRLYIGFTQDLNRRIGKHNAEESTYSRKYAPWELESYVMLKDKKTAEAFEGYLKSGSGYAFLLKHFLPALGEAERRDAA